MRALGAVCDVGDGKPWVGGWSEWAWFAGGSVNGSRYRVFERTSTYHAAQQHCLQLGGYLARIDTIREQVFIEDFLRLMLHKLIELDGQCTTRRSLCHTVLPSFPINPTRLKYNFFPGPLTGPVRDCF